jgi:hypothetical protein
MWALRQGRETLSNASSAAATARNKRTGFATNRFNYDDDDVAGIWRRAKSDD